MQEGILKTLETDIYPMLSPGLVRVLKSVAHNIMLNITEIRVRINQPLLLIFDNNDLMLRIDGNPAKNIAESYICTFEDVNKTLQLISKNSLYAYEQEIKLGYLTIKGGHRIGLTGQALIDEGKVKNFKNITSMNIRLAREVKGCADKIISYMIYERNRIFNTLIISPPRCGKTTILRDIVRLLSGGIPQTGFSGVQVGVVDERSEIGACRNGIPTTDLGCRVDVLDGCCKAQGLLMLIRSMSPQVVVTDELGRQEDVYAIREALTAGIGVIATMHGKDLEEILHRPYVGELIQNKYFDRYIILGSTPFPGSVEAILDKQRTILYSRIKGDKLCG